MRVQSIDALLGNAISNCCRTAQRRRPTKSVAGAYIYAGCASTATSQTTTTLAPAMVYNSRETGNSIFQDGRLKPGTYKIRNIVSKTFVDIKDDLRELCGRPSTALEQGRDHVSPQYG